MRVRYGALDRKSRPEAVNVCYSQCADNEQSEQPCNFIERASSTFCPGLFEATDRLALLVSFRQKLSYLGYEPSQFGLRFAR
jgi:hypothetical protein